VIIFVANVSPFCEKLFWQKIVSYHKFPEFFSIAKNDFLIYKISHNCQQYETAPFFVMRNFAEMQKETLLQAIFPFFILKKIAKLFLNKISF
jgi:hypothetical protein